MSQKSQPGSQSDQPDLLPEAPNNNAEDETEDTLPITYRPRANIHDPPSILHTRRVSIQDAPPTLHTRRVSIQEPPPIIYSRRVSIQDPPPALHTRRVSIQDPPPALHTRRVSIQEPPPALHSRRGSVQEPPSLFHPRWVSIKESPTISNSHQVSIQETSSISNSHGASFQDTSSGTYSSHVSTQEALPGAQTSHFSLPSPQLITYILNRESVASSSQVRIQDHLPTTPRLHSSLQGSRLPSRGKVDVPPSITLSPEASIGSIESIFGTSQENLKNSLVSLQLSETALDSSIHSTLPGSSVEASSGRFQDMQKRRRSQLPLGQRLLHEAKKISRQLGLALSLAGMVILGLISLGQPWIHFQVPLTPPGDPAGPLTIATKAIFFVRCTDISCLQEHDNKAYLLDFAWTSILIASITGSCLCLILVNLLFFTNSNLPILDFSCIILSILTGTSMVLGVLFYLMQAREFLQEGMTYRLGRSFYLAWMGIFFFMMTGFFSYLNYINFWCILALQGIWT